MRYFYRFLLLLLLLCVGAWVLAFSFANEGLLSLDLVFVQLPPLRVSVLVLLAFVAGGIFGLLAGSGAIWRALRSERALRRNLSRHSAS